MLPMLMRSNLSSGLLEDFFGKELFDNYRTKSVSYSTPAVNITEDEDKFRIEVAAPGMQKSDFNIESENNILTISANQQENQEDNQDSYLRKEFHYRLFRRSFTLPQSVNQDSIEASYTNGVLKVSLPKKEEAKRPLSRTISIS